MSYDRIKPVTNEADSVLRTATIPIKVIITVKQPQIISEDICLKEKCYELAHNQMVWENFGEKPDWVDLKASAVICGPFCPVRLGYKGNFGHLYSTNTLTLKYRQMHTYHFPALFHQAVGGQDVDLLPRPVHVFVAVDNGPYTLHRLASTLPNPAIYLKHSVHTTAKLACQKIAQWSPNTIFFFH